MAPSNCTLKYLPRALAGTVKCLRYQPTPKKGSPPSCGLNLRSNGPSMAQSWGRSSARQAASLNAVCSAPAASPLKKRQSSVMRMRRSAPILISVEAAAARPARESSKDVAARQEREKFRIVDSKDQVSAFRAARWDRRSSFVVCQSAVLWRGMTGHKRRWHVPLRERSLFHPCAYQLIQHWEIAIEVLVAFGENAVLLAPAHAAAGVLPVSGVELVDHIHAFHHHAERCEAILVLAGHIGFRDVDLGGTCIRASHGEGKAAARVGFAHRVVRQCGGAPDGGDGGIPGDAELREARGHAVEARVIVEAGADQVVEAIRADGRPVSMDVQNERASRGFHAHAVLRRRVLPPEAGVGVTQRRVTSGAGQREQGEQREQESHRFPVCDRIVGMSRTALAAFLVFLAAPLAAADYPAPTEGDYVVTDFQFATGETLPRLNLHYTTLG